MKNLITLVGVFSLLLFSTNTKAQGNLQFNSVQFLEGATSITVPAGKVWKVESVSASNIALAGLTYNHRIFINNHCVLGVNISTNQSAINVNGNLLPLWLPSGTYSITSSASSGNPLGTITVSALEFNVVP